MSRVDELLGEMARAGIRLWVEGGRIRFRAPAGAMTDERKGRIKACEAELLARLEAEARGRAGGEEIPRLPDAPRYEPSPGQRRLWILERLEGASAAYNVPLLHWLNGPLDIDALRAAFAGIAARHESLRTVIESVEGVPFQRVAPSIELLFSFFDLTREPDPGTAAVARARAFLGRAFDLARGPLFGVELYRAAPARHLLAVSLHHAVSDGVSIAVLGREIGEFYAAIREARLPLLPELRVQYRDYAAWRNRLVDDPAGLADLRRYWTARLAAPLPALDLPSDFPRPAVQGFAGAEETFPIDAATTAGLKDLCRKAGVTLFMGLAAAVKALLHRYTGAAEILVGTPVAGRDHVDIEPLIGLFINTLVLRDAIPGALPFEDFLAAVGRNAAEAFDHASYPFDLLVSDLALDRDLGRSPLFDVMVILQNQQAASSGLALRDVAVEAVSGHTGTAKFDLTFNFHEGSDGIAAAIEYRTDLFAPARIRRMGTHLVALIRDAIANPRRPVAQLEHVTAGERRELLETWGTRHGAYDLERMPLEMIERLIERSPDTIAVVSGQDRLTYGALGRLADRVAARLARGGVVPGDTVAVCTERTGRMVAALLGIWKAGAAYLPLDPGFPADRLDFMIRDAGARLLLADGAAPPGAPLTMTLEEACADGNDAPPRPPARPDAVAYIIYTSGSTGTPKGVEVTQRNLANFLLAMQEDPGLRADDRLLAVTTVSFDIAGLELFLPLVTGACTVVATRREATEPARLAGLLRESGATVMQATPATWKMLFMAGWKPRPGFKALVGGEAVSGRLVAQLLRAGCEVWNMYGPTETTIWSTTMKVEGHPSAWEAVPVVPIGRPIGGTIVRVLDAAGQPVPVGLPGDLVIGGDGVARGYRGRPGLTSERFAMIDVCGTGARRMYRTGDRAAWREDGTLDFLGRDDHQVKVRGYRIETGEVEAALAKWPEILESVVVACDDAEGEKELVAYVVPREPGATEAFDSDRLRPLLARTLPEYMIPSIFVTLARLPLTPNGKIDRRSLPPPRSIATPSVTLHEGSMEPAAAMEPRDERERVVRDIFARVLERDRVGIHDDFFSLGGHSLRATRAAYLLQEALGVSVELADLFRAPTAAALAARLAGRSASLDEILPVDVAPPSAEELALLDEGESRP